MPRCGAGKTATWRVPAVGWRARDRGSRYEDRMRALALLAIVVSPTLVACAPVSAPRRASVFGEQPLVTTAAATAPPREAPGSGGGLGLAKATPATTRQEQPTETTFATRPPLDPTELASERGLGASSDDATLHGRVAVGAASVTSGSMDDPRGVVAGLAPGFRACYERGLVEAPASQGTLRLKLLIGPGGEVTASTGSVRGDLSNAVVSCVRGRAAAATYPAPKNGGATLEIPITFTAGA